MITQFEQSITYQALCLSSCILTRLKSNGPTSTRRIRKWEFRAMNEVGYLAEVGKLEENNIEQLAELYGRELTW